MLSDNLAVCSKLHFAQIRLTDITRRKNHFHVFFSSQFSAPILRIITYDHSFGIFYKQETGNPSNSMGEFDSFVHIADCYSDFFVLPDRLEIICPRKERNLLFQFKELARESVIFTQLYVILCLVDISAAQVSIILLTFEVR